MYTLFSVSHLILRYIQPRQAKKIASISKYWRELLKDDSIWEYWLSKFIQNKSLLEKLIEVKKGGEIYKSYKGMVITYIIKKRKINFKYETTGEHLDSYIFQQATTIGLSYNIYDAYNKNNTNGTKGSIVLHKNSSNDYISTNPVVSNIGITNSNNNNNDYNTLSDDSSNNSVSADNFSPRKSASTTKLAPKSRRSKKQNYFLDIYVGGEVVEGGEIGFSLKLNGFPILNYKYLWNGTTNTHTTALLDNARWKQHDIVRCQVDSKNHTFTFYQNGRMVCAPAHFHQKIESNAIFKTGSAVSACAFTLRWARSGIQILQCKAY